MNKGHIDRQEIYETLEALDEASQDHLDEMMAFQGSDEEFFMQDGAGYTIFWKIIDIFHKNYVDAFLREIPKALETRAKMKPYLAVTIGARYISGEMEAYCVTKNPKDAITYAPCHLSRESLEYCARVCGSEDLQMAKPWLDEHGIKIPEKKSTTHPSNPWYSNICDLLEDICNGLFK